MSENETVTEDVKSETVEEVSEETQDTTDYKALLEQAEAEKKELKGRLSRAESKLERDRLKGMVEEKVEKVLSKNNTGELSDAQIDFFELKGFDEDQIKVFENIMKRTGMNHREVLKDEYAMSKAEAIKKEKEVKGAMPSATKRSGNGSSNDVAAALARYHATGEYPKDFELRAQVVDALMEQSSSNKPAWR